MKLLLLGAGGQVGRALSRTLPSLGTVVPTTRSGVLVDGTPCEALDVADAAAVGRMIERVAPDVVVNAVAYTAVDRAEDDVETAYAVNARAPAAMAAACADVGATLVHYSTDYVFDGTATRPYREDDPTAPLGVYGASKLAGERAVADSGARHLILRTAWVYDLHGHNFLRTMLRLAAERDELRVVDDQRGTPTPVWLIAETTTALLRTPDVPGGILHLTASGEASWCEFAGAIIQRGVSTGLLHRSPRLVPISTGDYPTRARRPAYTVLDTSRLSRYVVLPSWRNALDSTLR
ncbi:dTDP-4-dehydrorhamnose reductase [Tolypothrix campylonemoides VB511288]|nr:dTDP-4-dehydrorhamnose reductase [Tolypothrix campylonemoides VB511288]